MQKKSSSSLLAKLAAGAALAATFCAAHADTEQQARNAAIADGLTTAVGLAAGAVEMNPLGPVISLGMKAVLVQYAKTLPDTEQPRAFAMANSLWSGAAANNLCVAAAILSGGSFAPACVVLGVAWGMRAWQQTEHERAFWEGCALLRQYAGQPELECVYTPPEKALEADAQTGLVATRAQDLIAP